MPRTRLIAVLLGLALVAAACGSSATSNSSAQPSAAGGESALSGTFETLDGTSIDLGDLQGQDVVLWFWAPW